MKEFCKIKCKYGHDNKKCETCEIKYQNCECFLEYTNFKDNLIKCKCLCCNKNYQRKFDTNLKKWFYKIYTFSNHDINISLLYCCKKMFSLMNICGWLRKIQWIFITWKRRFLQ